MAHPTPPPRKVQSTLLSCKKVCVLPGGCTARFPPMRGDRPCAALPSAAFGAAPAEAKVAAGVVPPTLVADGRPKAASHWAERPRLRQQPCRRL